MLVGDGSGGCLLVVDEGGLGEGSPEDRRRRWLWLWLVVVVQGTE